MRRLSWIGLVALLLAAAPAWAITIVQLRTSEPVPVKCGEVTLGDVAVVSSDNRDLETKLRALRLALAAPPGQSRSISGEIIRIAVRGLGLDPDHIGLRRAGDVTIATQGSLIASAALLEMARDLVYSRLSFPPAAITIEQNNLPQDFYVPGGTLAITPEPPPTEDFIGLTFIPFAISVDGKLVRRVSLNITVRVTVPVVIANRSIARGTIVSAADFRLADRDLSTQPPGAITHAEDAFGKRARVTIAADQVVCDKMLEDPPLIRCQDQILIQVACGDIMVSAPGIALQDGRMGDEIRVSSSLGSGKAVTGCVVDRRTVLITLPGGVAR